ncbi:MAG: 4-amino-4-deoxychorismate lyase [Cryomorphaceae bacterium]
MTVLINGQPGDQISVHNRGLLYGQSLFETIAIADGQACLLTEHMQRLQSGAQILGLPIEPSAIIDEINQLAAGQQKAVIRVTLTMGAGGRGYLNPAEPESQRIVSLHEYPQYPIENWQKGIKLGLSNIRLGHQPALAGLKHGNRLEQILARSEWPDDCAEALLLDQSGNVVEATQSNIFIIKNNNLLTPKLELAGVAGVLRGFVLANANKVGVQAELVSLSLSDIEQADAVFLCNSVIGLWPVKQFQDQHYSDFALSNKLLKLIIKHGAIPNI